MSNSKKHCRSPSPDRASSTVSLEDRLARIESELIKTKARRHRRSSRHRTRQRFDVRRRFRRRCEPSTIYDSPSLRSSFERYSLKDRERFPSVSRNRSPSEARTTVALSSRIKRVNLDTADAFPGGRFQGSA